MMLVDMYVYMYYVSLIYFAALAEFTSDTTKSSILSMIST